MGVIILYRPQQGIPVRGHGFQYSHPNLIWKSRPFAICDNAETAPAAGPNRSIVVLLLSPHFLGSGGQHLSARSAHRFFAENVRVACRRRIPYPPLT